MRRTGWLRIAKRKSRDALFRCSVQTWPPPQKHVWSSAFRRQLSLANERITFDHCRLEVELQTLFHCYRTSPERPTRLPILILPLRPLLAVRLPQRFLLALRFPQRLDRSLVIRRGGREPVRAVVLLGVD